MFLLLLLAGCGLPACETLCADRADCVEAEIVAAGSSWAEWTGFDDRAAYEAACVQVYTDSLDLGGERGDLNRLCGAEEACPE